MMLENLVVTKMNPKQIHLVLTLKMLGLILI